MRKQVEENVTILLAISKQNEMVSLPFNNNFISYLEVQFRFIEKIWTFFFAEINFKRPNFISITKKDHEKNSFAHPAINS